METVFANALTGCNLGAAAGGADFNPHNKSEAEIQRYVGQRLRSSGGWRRPLRSRKEELEKSGWGGKKRPMVWCKTNDLITSRATTCAEVILVYVLWCVLAGGYMSHVLIGGTGVKIVCEQKKNMMRTEGGQSI